MSEPTNINRRPVKQHENQKAFHTEEYGTFTLNRPSLATQIEIHKFAARRLEGITNIDGIGEAINLMMSTIHVCAMSGDEKMGETPAGFPRDFSWEKCYEWDFLTPLYQEFTAWVGSFRKPRTPANDSDGSAGGGEGAPLSGQEGVQPPAD